MWKPIVVYIVVLLTFAVVVQGSRNNNNVLVDEDTEIPCGVFEMTPQSESDLHEAFTWAPKQIRMRATFLNFSSTSPQIWLFSATSALLYVNPSTRYCTFSFFIFCFCFLFIS